MTQVCNGALTEEPFMKSDFVTLFCEDVINVKNRMMTLGNQSVHFSVGNLSLSEFGAPGPSK